MYLTPDTWYNHTTSSVHLIWKWHIQLQIASTLKPLASILNTKKGPSRCAAKRLEQTLFGAWLWLKKTPAQHLPRTCLLMECVWIYKILNWFQQSRILLTRSNQSEILLSHWGFYQSSLLSLLIRSWGFGNLVSLWQLDIIFLDLCCPTEDHWSSNGQHEIQNTTIVVKLWFSCHNSMGMSRFTF